MEFNRQFVKGFAAACDTETEEGTRYTINFRGEGNGLKITQISFFAPKSVTTMTDDDLMAFLENMRGVMQEQRTVKNN